MGENRWEWENDPWPPANIDIVKYHLHSDGRANTMMGDGELSAGDPGEEKPDEYTFDPKDPVVTVMDLDLYGGGVETPLDNRFMLRRDDVLVYTSDPLDEALTMAGRPLVILYASSDCADTDWFATISDVHPDGRSIGLGGGLLRARYRDSLEKPKLMNPGEIYRFVIELTSTCITFHRGHRIRLSVTSSAFPRFARNLNTGEDFYGGTEIKVAKNTLHHDRTHPSHLLLPIKRSDPS
jgi:putative CocE/NonD family hydrolase